MEQRKFIHFLTLKGLRAFAIAAELKLAYETEVLALSTVKKWRRPFAEGRTSLYDDLRDKRPLANDSAEAVPSMLKKRLSLSGMVLCRRVRIANGICLRVLQDTHGMKKFHLRWILHAMNTNQKAERITLSHGILWVLQSIRCTGFQSVITGDESCFFCTIPVI
jgi:hypothetical protein